MENHLQNIVVCRIPVRKRRRRTLLNPLPKSFVQPVIAEVDPVCSSSVAFCKKICVEG
jgi:hypothetical protein